MTLINRIKEKLVLIPIYLALTWVILAVIFQMFMVGLHFAGQEETIRTIVNWFDWKFDGRFKNSPGNIWYEEPKVIHVGSVTNAVVVGPLTGNRKLEFGVKNVIEEVLQDKEYNLDSTASMKLTAEIIYLDVLKTESSFSVIHKNKESVVIRLRGQLLKDGKVKKKATVEESADEISLSTLAIDQGGKFNQQNLSSALKKASESLVNKLIN
jgi:hypothetical protein